MTRTRPHHRHHRRGSGPAQPRLEDFPGAICSRCEKPGSLCVCDEVVRFDNRVAVLILQHPQEQDKMLGSARLAVQHFADATLRVGLSWPSLAKALSRPAAYRAPDPKRWAVLHLGAAHAGQLPKGREAFVLDSKGAPVPDQDQAFAGIEGVVLFDGTWSQAKTLWWRNPWVLKLRRVALAPRHASRYGALRREPRKEGLSTLEAAALLVSRLEARSEIEKGMLASFERMLAKYRAAAKDLRTAGAETEAKPASP